MEIAPFSVKIICVKTPLKILFFIVLSLAPAAAEASSDNASLFLGHCASCHGADGNGAKAPALKKEGLLQTVGIGYFTRSMRFGRPLRGCPSFEGRLSDDEMRDISAYIKGWQKGSTLDAPDHDVIPAKTGKGEDLFSLCGGCHGLEGEGAMGPPLLDKGFLSSISDTELRRTIMWGRPGTPMKGYLKGMGGMTVLTEEEIDTVISYLRYRQMQMK